MPAPGHPKKPLGAESVWSDDWLNPLHAYPSALRSRGAPADSAGWTSLADFTAWLNHSGLAEEWVRPRDPGWWLEESEAAKDLPEARAALVSHAVLRDAWRGDAKPSRWGDVVATWFRDVEPSERDRSITAILQAAPKSARPSFARALLKGLTPSGAEAVLEQLRSDPAADRAMLLPLEASAAVAAILEGAEPTALGSIVEEARTWPGATSGVLDAIEAGIADRTEAMPSFAAVAAVAFDPEGPGEGREGIAWALRRGQLASAWLAPALRPVLAEPGRQSTWLTLRNQTPEELRASLARVVLGISADDGLPDEAFRWGVEGLLMPLAPRPADPSWAETYLMRTPQPRPPSPPRCPRVSQAWPASLDQPGEGAAARSPPSSRLGSTLAWNMLGHSLKGPGTRSSRSNCQGRPGQQERGRLLDQMLGSMPAGLRSKACRSCSTRPTRPGPGRLTLVRRASGASPRRSLVA